MEEADGGKHGRTDEAAASGNFFILITDIANASDNDVTAAEEEWAKKKKERDLGRGIAFLGEKKKMF